MISGNPNYSRYKINHVKLQNEQTPGSSTWLNWPTWPRWSTSLLALSLYQPTRLLKTSRKRWVVFYKATFFWSGRRGELFYFEPPTTLLSGSSGSRGGPWLCNRGGGEALAEGGSMDPLAQCLWEVKLLSQVLCCAGIHRNNVLFNRSRFYGNFKYKSVDIRSQHLDNSKYQTLNCLNPT